MILRRLLIASLVLLCWHNLPAQEIKPAPTDCPQADGYTWTTKYLRPSGKVLWVQVRTQQQFEWLCGRASACAIRFEELTLLVSQSPAWTMGEAIRHHEECHDAWDHGAAPTMSLMR